MENENIGQFFQKRKWVIRYSFPLLLLTGCDTVPGLRRIGPISNVESLTCIEKSITDVAGIKIIDRDIQHRDKSTIDIIGEFPKEVTTFYYEKDSTRAFLQVYEYMSKKEIHQYIAYMNPPRSFLDTIQKQADKMRPVMLQIEKNIQSNCSDSLFQTKIIESCSGIKCAK